MPPEPKPMCSTDAFNRRFVARATVATALALVCAQSDLLAQQRYEALPPIRHVFVIVLENQGFDSTFRAESRAPYLTDSLVPSGALLTQYYGTGHFSLGNYAAMIAGVAPTRETQIDCPRYVDFVDTAKAKGGQPSGTGCIYPARVPTLANQLEAKHLTWKGFMEDMGSDPARESATCGHPPIGDRKSTRLNSSHRCISYAVFCLKKKNRHEHATGAGPLRQ